MKARDKTGRALAAVVERVPVVGVDADADAIAADAIADATLDEIEAQVTARQADQARTVVISTVFDGLDEEQRG